MSRRKNPRTVQPLDDKRDVWEVAGWPQQITFEQLHTMYKRSGLANAVVTRPVQLCWSSLPKIFDFKGDGEPTLANSKFEEDVAHLESIGFFTALAELDEYQRVGAYAGMVIVAREMDKVDPKEPLKVAGVQSLIGFRPCFEGELEPVSLEDDFSSKDFGNPKTWNYQPNLYVMQRHNLQQTNLEVHKTRVFTYSENATGNSVFGVSPLEIVYNGLSAAVKTLVAGSEGLFRNAKQPINLNITDPQAGAAMMNNPTLKKQLDDQVEDFSNSFSKSLTTWGTDVKSIQSTMIDPASTFEITVKDVSAGADIPTTVLIANEVGQLASTENLNQWHAKGNSRRETKLNPMIISSLKLLISVGAVSAPVNGIHIQWDDLMERSEGDKLDLSTKMVTINKTHYDAGGVEPVYTTKEVRSASGYETEEEDGDFE